MRCLTVFLILFLVYYAVNPVESVRNSSGAQVTVLVGGFKNMHLRIIYKRLLLDNVVLNLI